jgi:ADP-ribose pyrophosphatase
MNGNILSGYSLESGARRPGGHEKMRRSAVVKSSETIYRGKRITVTKDIVMQPNGETAMREVVKFANAAACVPLTKKREVVLIRQFRYPAGGYLYEIPAGILNRRERPAACAVREVEEETGFRARKLTFIGKIHPSPGVCTEVIYLFLAEDLEKSLQNLERGEDIKVQKFALNKALQMITDGKITDAKTICALFLVQKRLARRRKGVHTYR